MNLEEALQMATNTVAEPVGVTPVVQPTMTQPMQTEVAPMAYTAPVQPQVQVAPVAPVQPMGVPSMPSIDLNQAQEQAMASYGTQTISFGQVISTRAIDTVKKLNKGDSFRFTIIAPDIQFIKVHKQGMSNIECFGGQCCIDLGDPRPRYFLPVLVYSTMPNDPTTPLPQGKSELKLLNLWSDVQWKELSLEVTNNPLNFKGDFIATCKSEFGELSFRAQGTSFRQMPEYTQAIQDAEQKWPQIKDRAVESVCRHMDATKYAQQMLSAQVPQMQTYTSNDIF